MVNISDLLTKHNSDPIFSVPDGENDDVKERMEAQIKGDKGVAFDIRLGEEYFLSGENLTRSSKRDQGVHIEPGQFALLTTYETFHMPVDLAAFISMRFSVKVKGLINVSGFQVDPGYQGVFVFSVFNTGPKRIDLDFKQTIFTVIFSNTSQPKQSKNSKVVKHIKFEHWTWLTDKKNLSVIGLDDRIKRLERDFSLAKYVAPIAAVAAGIIGFLMGLP